MKGRPAEVMSFQGNTLTVEALRILSALDPFNPRES